jgi:hypothetical protein
MANKVVFVFSSEIKAVSPTQGTITLPGSNSFPQDATLSFKMANDEIWYTRGQFVFSAAPRSNDLNAHVERLVGTLSSQSNEVFFTLGALGSFIQNKKILILDDELVIGRIAHPSSMIPLENEHQFFRLEFDYAGEKEKQRRELKRGKYDHKLVLAREEIFTPGFDDPAKASNFQLFYFNLEEKDEGELVGDIDFSFFNNESIKKEVERQIIAQFNDFLKERDEFLLVSRAMFADKHNPDEEDETRKYVPEREHLKQWFFNLLMDAKAR